MTNRSSLWANGTVYKGAIYDDTNVEKGRAAFLSTWVESNGAPPSPLLMGRADDKGKLRVLYAQTRVAGPEEERANAMDIAVAPPFYEDTKVEGDPADHVDVKFKRAGFLLRVRYIPGALGSVIVAAAALVGGIVAAVIALVSGITKPSAPEWLVVIGAVVAIVVALAKFWLDVRDKTK